jgi:hypothetical protein
MRISITTVQNGWIMTLSETGEMHKKTVYQTDNEVYDNLSGTEGVEAYRNMLYDLTDALGMSGGRYDKKRIRINIEPGDKCEGDNE